MPKNYLKGFRGYYGITQAQISNILGITEKTYSGKENSNNFSRDEMLLIYEFAKTYDKSVTINQLFGLPD